MSEAARVNILLVDDQAARLMSYETILKPLDQNLVAARSGPEALELLMQQDFAVILLDVSMPGMDGFEAAALIHQHPRFEKTPIIFVTGVHLSELDKLKGYELGAVDYVYVPVVPEILRSKVSVLVELHHQRLELQRLNRSLEEAHARLQLSHTQLQAERTRELEALNATLTRTNDDLAVANRALHAEVAVREKAELALKEADRHKDAFLAVLAHELRNPLAPIRNAVEIMRRRSVDDKDLIWAREVIGRQLLQLTRLVDDLLDVSRITRGHITLSLEPVQIATVVERAIETVQPLIAEHGHELTVEIPDDALEVSCDLTRITQALANLLSNAAKYTDRGGRIAVRVAREGGSVAVRVTDTGIGMDAALVPKLFSLFSQADSAKARSPGGLGIGLALARQLVELQGGSVAAYSAGHNLGSEFVIRLPLLPAAEQSGQRAATDQPPPAQQGAPVRRRILLADDNKDSLDSLALLLSHEGYEVRAVLDGAQAMAVAAEYRPNVALLDIGMPKHDGCEVARWIRSQPWGQSLLLIAVTGWGQDDDKRRTREAGFDHHMVKPVTLDDLFEILKTVAVLDESAAQAGRTQRRKPRAKPGVAAGTG